VDEITSAERLKNDSHVLLSRPLSLFTAVLPYHEALSGLRQPKIDGVEFSFEIIAPQVTCAAMKSKVSTAPTWQDKPCAAHSRAAYVVGMDAPGPPAGTKPAAQTGSSSRISPTAPSPPWRRASSRPVS